VGGEAEQSLEAVVAVFFMLVDCEEAIIYRL
jgi:hypothetical protein